MEASDCGAASLGMILAYYGKFVPLEELRLLCGVTLDGVSVLKILNTANRYGLFAEAHTVSLEELYDMPLPLVIHWYFKHFLVIEGFSKNGVFVNDPVRGAYMITYELLNSAFTGLAVVFTPGPTFEKTGKSQSAVQVIQKLLHRAHIPFIFAFLTGLCLVIPGLAVPAFTQIFIDNILVNHIYSWEGWLLIAMVFVASIAGLLKYLQLRILSRLYIQLSTAFSSDFLWHILRLPYYFYVKHQTGDLANRITYNDSIARIVATRLTTMIIDAIVALIFGAAMFYYDPLIAAFGVAIMAGVFLLMAYLYRSRHDAYYYYQQASGRGISYGIEALRGMETIKATGNEFSFFSNWAGYYAKGLNVMQKIGAVDVHVGILPDFLKLLTLIMILSFGAWRVINGHLTVGMLMALVILMENFTAPITRLANFNQIMQLLKVDTSRVNDILNNPVDKVLIKAEKEDEVLLQAIGYPKLKGGIEINNVSFGYDKDADPILKNISFTVTPGTCVGIVGASGSGKSTLSNVIAGLIRPWNGSIAFDQQPSEKLPRSVIVNSLALVEQMPKLFFGTIKDNIAFFNPLISQEEIVKAAKDACIHDVIIARKEGYNLELQTNASNLSGGERQRIELARAFAKQPSILVLDEATSALDTDIEAVLMENIRLRGRTCLIIAHRLSTTLYCDEIIVLDKGVIVQKGSPEELLKQPGFYKEMIEFEKIIEQKRETSL